MSDVFEASLQLPTLLFTCLGVVCALIWSVSLIGIIDIDGGEEVAGGTLDDVLSPFGLAEVPVLVLASILALVGWVVSVLAQLYLLESATGLVLAAFAVGVSLVALCSAIGVSMLIGPRLSKLLTPAHAGGGRDLVGRIAEVRSVNVTARTGYADTTWSDGRGERVDVRVSPHGDVAPDDLHNGDRVLLISWDAAENVYFVARVPDDLE